MLKLILLTILVYVVISIWFPKATPILARASLSAIVIMIILGIVTGVWW